MAGINVKWPGQHIAEDTTHRLVTDEQIEFWNSNGVIELTPTNFKDYVIDESKLYVQYSNSSWSNEGTFIENLQPGHYRINLGFNVLISSPESYAEDGNNNDGYSYYIKHDWVTLFGNIYYDTKDKLLHSLNNADYGYNNMLECGTFGISDEWDMIEYVEFEVFEKTNSFFTIENDYNLVIVTNWHHVYYKYDNIINGVREISDWNNATENGVYSSSYELTHSSYDYIDNKFVYNDNESMHMPLPVNYDGIFNLVHVFYNSEIVSYIGRVTASTDKIIQELELNVSMLSSYKQYEEDFMKALGVKFIRYGLRRNEYNEIIWSNWYIINYDLGTVDSNLTNDFDYMQEE